MDSPSTHRATFTVVIPTRNERRDIDSTLIAIANQTDQPAEVLIVDDSDDDTREIVERRRKSLPQLRVIAGSGGGRCVARNTGIQAASGDIIVILNADVRIPSDFIERLRRHYESGADYVLVNSEVANPESFLAAFIGAQSTVTYADHSKVNVQWTEGFSCRRDVLIRSGMFPVTPIPLVAGEDGELGRRLSDTAVRRFDGTITVYFVAPSDIGTFWRTYKERAYPLVSLYLWHKTVTHVATRNFLKFVWRTICTLTLIPNILYAGRLSNAAQGSRLRHLLVFTVIKTYQDLAYTVGDWEGLVRYVAREWRHPDCSRITEVQPALGRERVNAQEKTVCD